MPSTSTTRSTSRAYQLRRTTNHRTRITTVAVASLALSAALASCNTTDTTAAPVDQLPVAAAPIPTAPAQSSTTTPSRWRPDEQAVIDVYQAFLAASHEAMLTNDGNLPALDRTATGVLRQTVRQKLADREQQGLRVRPAVPSKERAEVYWVSVDGDSAHLAACAVDDAVLYRAATGEISNDAVETVRQVARFERIEGTWKVAAHEVKGDKITGDELDRCIAVA